MRNLANALQRHTATACLVALIAWTVIQYRESVILSLPTPLLWLVVIAAFVGGYLLAAWLGEGETPPPAWLAAAGVAAAGSGLIVLGNFGASPDRHHLAPVALWLAGGLGGPVAERILRRRLTPSLVLVAGVLALWALLGSYVVIRGFGLYDLHVYLAGGERWAAGQQPYLVAPLTRLPASAAQDAFLYPPVFLPPFAALARLPFSLTAALWVTTLFVAALVGLRAIGLRWSWAVALLAFPPLLKGIDSGNVANLVFLSLVAGPVYGSSLFVGGWLKLQGWIATLWIIRERKWRSLAIGAAATLALVLASLPVVGVSSWVDWVRGLGFRETSQQNLPILYGNSLAQFLPLPVFAFIAVVAVGVSLLPRGRASLAALGLATVIATPSLWPHGFLLALPALLYLDTPLFWLAMGVGTTGFSRWFLVLFGAWALIRRHRRRPEADDILRPTASAAGPWGRLAEPLTSRSPSASGAPSPRILDSRPGAAVDCASPPAAFRRACPAASQPPNPKEP